MPIYSRLKLIWDETLCISPTTSKWSKTAQPLPHPPFHKNSNTVFLKIITDNFFFLSQVQTPINIDIFEYHLQNHPNSDFVHSACVGLWEGFWPWLTPYVMDFQICMTNHNQLLTMLSTQLSCMNNASKNNSRKIFLHHLDLNYFLACIQCQYMQFLNLIQLTYALSLIIV